MRRWLLMGLAFSMAAVPYARAQSRAESARAMVRLTAPGVAASNLPHVASEQYKYFQFTKPVLMSDGSGWILQLYGWKHFTNNPPPPDTPLIRLVQDLQGRIFAEFWAAERPNAAGDLEIEAEFAPSASVPPVMRLDWGQNIPQQCRNQIVFTDGGRKEIPHADPKLWQSLTSVTVNIHFSYKHHSCRAPNS